MRRAHAFVPAVFGLMLAPHGIGKSLPAQGNNRQIEVRISAKSKIIRAGQPLELRVEIRNVGGAQLFIEKDIYEPCSHSPLTLSLDLGPPLKPGLGGWGCAADCIDDPKQSFANRLVERWISLPAGHFYGALVSIDPDFFPELKTPGRWRLRGKYSSGGDLTSSICLSPVPLDRHLTDALPYRAWKGQEETNVVWIRVLSPRRASKSKR
jgi:hypothetical protein